MRFAHVAAVAKFADVFPRVLRRNVNVSALDGALEQRPVAFQPVHVMDAPNVLFRRMIDGAVVVGEFEAVIGFVFVGADNRASRYVLVDDAFYSRR
jgi:hypothetical protein